MKGSRARQRGLSSCDAGRYGGSGHAAVGPRLDGSLLAMSSEKPQENCKQRKQTGRQGWRQNDYLEPDAYATGLVLYALHEAGSARTDGSAGLPSRRKLSAFDTGQRWIMACEERGRQASAIFSKRLPV